MAALLLPEIFRVGGSVRDEAIGRQSKDSDYMVKGATLDEVKAALVAAGAKVAALRLREGREQIGWRAEVKGVGMLEITLPRTEVSTGPGRHDFDITVDPNLSLVEDAVRRDFTINAMYLNVRTQETLDPLGTGLRDIKRGEINTTTPGSFVEDPLRMLRALRFVSKLPGFKLGGETYNFMHIYGGGVTGLTRKGVSGTAFDELCGILMGDFPGMALRIARDTGVLAALLPELAPMLGFEQRSRYHEKTTDEHTFDAVQAAANMHGEAPLAVRLALLFHDCGKPEMAWIGKDGLQHYYALSSEEAIKLKAPIGALKDHEWWSAYNAKTALNRINVPNKLRKEVITLIERHMVPLHENIRPFKVRQWRSELGEDLFHSLIVHRTCDVIGKGGDTTEAIEVLSWIADEAQRAKEKGVPITIKELKIDGHDLMELGYSGRAIGDCMKTLLHEVLAQPKLNEHEWLVGRAAKIKTKGA